MASPSFAWEDAPRESVRSLGTEVEDGQRTQVIAFFEEQGEVSVWFRLWVDCQGLVRRAEMTAQAHFMVDHYRDFDAPFTIEPPSGCADRRKRSPAARSPVALVTFDSTHVASWPPGLNHSSPLSPM